MCKEKSDKEAEYYPSESSLCFCQRTSTSPKDQSDYITLQREEDEHKGWRDEDEEEEEKGLQ